MKPRSVIEKGKRFANYCNHQIEEIGLGRACNTPGSGSGRLKGDSFNNLDFLLEYKNEKSFPKQVIKNIKQAKIQSEKGNYQKEKWALVVRNPETPESNPEVFAIIDFWEFLKLLKRNSDPMIKQPDKEMRSRLEWLKSSLSSAQLELKDHAEWDGVWKMDRAKKAINEVLKILP